MAVAYNAHEELFTVSFDSQKTSLADTSAAVQ
jgi:hypothetical protein